MDQQHQRNPQQPQALQFRRRAALQRHDGEIDLPVHQPRLHLGAEPRLQAEAHLRMMLVQQLHHRRQVLPQHQLRRPDADLRRRALAQARPHRVEILEKWLHERVKLLPLGREAERAAVKQPRPEIQLQLADLAAHRGLLDAIGNVPHRPADPAVLGDVIEQLQVMNIHRTGAP